ncbi:tRNA (N(6)-L-threonylcarbamoyladenosine(37)-C(2))-methylthiotransferase [Candidatus Woesearchaeota archaeon]|nr:tRNA (N(6)-L-threonylcarbamoyladenosine(37)-C(2))-methylthiotransferase [Candidatus Woesearchaeota archaeon]
MTTVSILTQGCSANAAESEMMAGLLKKAGFTLDKRELADIVLVNVCTVKGETTALKAIRKIKERDPTKKVVIAGCVTQRLLTKIREIDEGAGIINTHNVHNVVSIVEETVHDTPLTALSREPEVKIGLPRVQKNPVIGIIPILNSCASHCTFCSTKLVKGKLLSYPKEAIIAEARRMIAKGCKELWVTSQDNGAYMLDKGQHELPALLEELCALQGDFKIRLGMTNPTHVIKMVHPLIKAYKDPHMFQFLHIPIQAGNDRILELMKRENTVEEYLSIIDTFKKAFPGMTIATDIITGFPTETEKEFLDTVDLIRKTMPDIVNISRYRPRYGTLAARMEQVPGDETKRRSRLLTTICNNVSQLRNETWLGWQGDILIDEQGKDGTWIGRNFAYKQVIVQGTFSLGEKVPGKVTKVTPWDLHAVTDS